MANEHGLSLIYVWTHFLPKMLDEKNAYKVPIPYVFPISTLMINLISRHSCALPAPLDPCLHTVTFRLNG